MWHKITMFFRKDTTRLPELLSEKTGEITGEIGDVKKLLRKQGVAIESLRHELNEERKAAATASAVPYLDLADNFFHFTNACFPFIDFPESEAEEALGIVWKKIDAVLALHGLQMIREAGVPFNSKIHEAVENTTASGEDPVVVEFVQPGYLLRGSVVRPARVVLGTFISEESKAENRPVNSEENI